MASFCITLFDTIDNPAENDACFLTAVKNLTINKGSGYKINFTISKDSSPVNLIGYALRGQIKSSATSSEVLLNMTSANLLLQINNETSTISMTIPESFTRRVSQVFAVYDIELLNSTEDAFKIISGIITFA